MTNTRTNERELAGKVSEWFNEHILRNDYPFTSCSPEAGIKTENTTHFGDLIIWKSRETNEAYSYMELKPPFIKEDLKTFYTKAIQLKVKFAFTWDFQNLNIYKIENNKVILLDTIPTNILKSINDWLRGDKQAEIKAWIRRICDEIEKLNKTGKSGRFVPEKIYFINFIRDVVKTLIPEFEGFIRDKHRKGIFKKEIDKYVYEQGITYPSDKEFYGLIARQRVYGLVTKIIFYLTIRRFFKELPDLVDTEETDLNHALKVAFAQAANRDWQAVFLPDPIEELGIPNNAQLHLRKFFKELKVYSFNELKEDVVGELFEEIIDPTERHLLGQYFTREDLVDFVIASVVTDKDGIYADPTCGSGTFLIRLYDRLKYLSQQRKTHVELLNQIWGIDIAKFPAELSTINLFRQRVENFENFPRVINRSIFEIKKGYITEFPPTDAGLNYTSKIKIPLPQFNAFVGNFPYIRQELIEKKDKGFKELLTKLLAEEYFFSYPKLFDTNNKAEDVVKHIQTQPKETQNKELWRLIKGNKISLRLSGQADIYAYIFIHTATLLAKQGSFAIITSNSWLDVSYGKVLKEFFLDHFSIKMIVATWAEPWFDSAAVNTVVTVLEKKNENDSENNLVRFVKLKKKFNELIPFHDLQVEGIKRWQCIDGLIRTIDASENHKRCRKISDTMKELDLDEMRIRLISQSELRIETNEKGEMSKWGKYLRAPNVYFELMEECKDKLVPLKSVADVRWGVKTGINDFFYLEPIVVDNSQGKFSMVEEPVAEYFSKGKKKTYYIECQNKRGWVGEIETKYLKKVINTPKQIDSFFVEPDKLNLTLFVCNKSKEELKREGDYGALKYIEWGEKQSTREGQKWSDVPSVRAREHWWSIIEEGEFEYIIPQFYDKKFVVPELNNKAVATNNFFVINSKPNQQIPHPIFFNSTLFYFFIEVTARNNMGDGVLTLYGPDINSTYVLSKKVKLKFNKIISRTNLPIFEEVKQKDRIELDTAILKALGLDSKEWLPRIYKGICEMVQERLELPKMRKKQKKDKQEFAYDEIKQSVIKDILPNGVRKFPEAFYTGKIAYEKLSKEIITTTELPLKSDIFFTQVEVKDSESKSIYKTDSSIKAEFVITLAKPGCYTLLLPKDENVCDQIMKKYRNYVEQIKTSLEANASNKLHDWNLADKMAKEIMKEFGIL